MTSHEDNLRYNFATFQLKIGAVVPDGYCLFASILLLLAKQNSQFPDEACKVQSHIRNIEFVDPMEGNILQLR